MFRTASGLSRSVTILMVLGLVAIGCGDDEATARPTVATRSATTAPSADPFCREAIGFDDFVDRNGTDLLEAASAEAYMSEAQDRLGAMLDLAPAQEIADLEIILETYGRLDDDLSAVAYDLSALDDTAFRSNAGSEASQRLDAFLFAECGFDPLAGLPFEGEAPQVLDDAELGDLVDDDDEAEVVRALAEQFRTDFDLADDEADCLAENMDRDSVVAIASGGVVTDTVAADFAATLERCGIRPEQLDR